MSWIGGGDSTMFTNYVGNLEAAEIECLRDGPAAWDRGMPFSLVPLPSSYNELFEAAAFAKCPRKGVTPKYSAICLICGCYVCMECCDEGQVTKHAAECNNGFCAFLWLQKSKIIIVWNKLAALYKSVYLDKYGEEDYGLIRGNRITLNPDRYLKLTQIITEHNIPNRLVQLRKTPRDLLDRMLNL